MIDNVKLASTGYSRFVKLLTHILFLPAAVVIGYFGGSAVAGKPPTQWYEVILVLFAISFFIWRLWRNLGGMTKADKGQFLKKTVIQIICGGVVGFAIIFLFDSLLSGSAKPFAEEASYWQFSGLAASLFFLFFSILLFILSASFRAFALGHSGHDLVHEEYTAQRPIFFWSALGCLTYAAALAVLSIFGSNNPETGLQNSALVAIVIAMVVNVGISIILWKQYDELWREVTKASSALSYVVVEIVIICWAALTLFGYNVTFDPLGVVVMMLGVYLLASVYFTIRHGLDNS